MAARHPGETLSPPKPRPAGKPPEMDGWSNRHIFHPLARRLAAALALTLVSPNMVSLGGGLLVAAAALLYVGLDWPSSVLLGFAAHASWHVLDGADGELARLTGKASPAGELVDGVCDYAGHVFLYILFAAVIDDSLGGWAWAAAAAAGVSRILQSNHAETQRRIYLWRVYGVPWLQHAQASNDALFEERSLFARTFAPMASGYIALAALVSPSSKEVDAIVEGTSASPRARARISRLCKQAARGPLRLQIWLGANPRTFILGISMAAGSPIYFFLAECTLLNLLLVWSVAEQKRCNRRLAARLEAVSS